MATSPQDILRLINPQEIWLHFLAHLQHDPVSVLTCFTLLVVATLYVMLRSQTIYLVDYACAKPPPELMVPYSIFRGHSEKSGCFDFHSLDFQRKILERSGLGEQTYLPPAMHVVPARPTMAAARAEAEDVMFGAINSLFDRTGINPKDIGILIVNCSLFNPAPSLSDMLVHKYKLRGNIRSYSLGGMGCSAGVISIDLAKRLLQVHRNTYALVISMENITQNWYFGNCKSMLIPNCLFRVGGAAILLSNKRKERGIAKYQLLHTVRTHKGADDRAFHCVFQQEDEKGERGVSLSKDLMTIAGNALHTNITTLGPLVLPLSELLLFLGTLIAKKVLKKQIKSYKPDFKLAFEHFCIHAGGVQSLMSLRRTCNCCRSTWRHQG
ncbi:hypothetical protein L7F22_058674 [Adiantum nelumboides]|nr:hypothetical protein [Adiantum nelumboides]